MTWTEHPEHPEPPERSEPSDPGADDPGAEPSVPDAASPPASGRTLALGVAVTVLVLAAAAVMAIWGSDGREGATEEGPVPTVDGDEPPTLADRPGPSDSAPLPDADLEAFEGEGVVATGDYRGTPLIVNFWASWCAPCVDEIPELQAVAEAGHGDLAVLGINLQDDHDKASELVASLGVGYDLASDPEGELFAEVEGFGMPTTLFVDAAGDIRYRFTGPLDAAAMADLSEEHLGVVIDL